MLCQTRRQLPYIPIRYFVSTQKEAVTAAPKNTHLLEAGHDGIRNYFSIPPP
jgi:hypothetical protein